MRTRPPPQAPSGSAGIVDGTYALCRQPISSNQKTSPNVTIVETFRTQSITPEKNFLKVKETVPPEQSGKLVPTPSNLVFVALGWSGNAPAVTIEAYHPIANKWFYIPQNVFVKR
ncbi:hypothetical protein TNCV_2108061 [Trichonephila clavipes]|nr:hypothetical protein TNCV_2108061 [Trichonephila clavipes]